MNYQVGDLVYWETQPEKTFTIEELDDKNFTYDRIWSGRVSSTFPTQ